MNHEFYDVKAKAKVNTKIVDCVTYGDASRTRYALKGKCNDTPARSVQGEFGNDVKDGVYFVLVKAKGADGRKFNIKKDVNLLRGFTEDGGSTAGN